MAPPEIVQVTSKFYHLHGRYILDRTMTKKIQKKNPRCSVYAHENSCDAYGVFWEGKTNENAPTFQIRNRLLSSKTYVVKTQLKFTDRYAYSKEGEDTGDGKRYKVGSQLNGDTDRGAYWNREISIGWNGLMTAVPGIGMAKKLGNY